MTETWEPNKAGQLTVKRARLAARSSYFGLIGLFTGDAVLITFQGATIAVAIQGLAAEHFLSRHQE